MNDKKLYVQVENELAGEPRKYTDRALWTKAKTLAKGDEEKTKYTYIELRVKELKEKEELRVKELKEKEQEKELIKQEKLNSKIAKVNKEIFQECLRHLFTLSIFLCLTNFIGQYSVIGFNPSFPSAIGEFIGSYLSYLLMMGVLGGISYGVYKLRNLDESYQIKLLVIPSLGIILFTLFSMFAVAQNLHWGFWVAFSALSWVGVFAFLGHREDIKI